MAASEAFRDPRRKLERARKHLDDLDALIREWLTNGHGGGRPYEVLQEFDVKRHGYFVRAKIVAQPADHTGLIAADVVHNLRSALDQVVYELASRRRKRVPANTGFPIHRTEFDYVCRGSPMIAALPEPARAVIEGMQPYHREDPATAYLAILNDLWNTDKHRSIPTVAPLPRTLLTHIGRGDPADVLPVRYDTRREGEIVARIGVRRGAKVELQADIALDVCFGEAGKATGAPVYDTLQQMHRFIRDDVVPSFLPFA